LEMLQKLCGADEFGGDVVAEREEGKLVGRGILASKVESLAGAGRWFTSRGLLARRAGIGNGAVERLLAARTGEDGC
jgi:hypothetical protein